MPNPTAPASWLPRKAAVVLLVLALAVLLTYLVPVFARFRPLQAGELRGGIQALASVRPAAPLVRWQEDPPAPAWPPPISWADTRAGQDEQHHARAGLEVAAVLWARAERSKQAAFTMPPSSRAVVPGAGIEGPSGALRRFFDALARTSAREPDAVTRILHFGDSPITGDLIAGGARQRLQERFGDSGHGFIFVDRPWGWYNHRGVELEASGWHARSPLLHNGGDGLYGLAGVAFTGTGPGARTAIRTAEKGLGGSVSRFDLYLGSRPGGGTLRAQVDDGEVADIPTVATDPGFFVHSLAVPDGPHELALWPAGDGPVTAYGVVLERDTPGLVYDSLGTNGGTVHFLATFDAEHWETILKVRRPDLVILNFGTNEAGYGYLPLGAYAADIRTVVGRIRAAVPSVSILLMAPMDRGTTNEFGEIVTMPTLAGIIATQRATARELGCAVFDTFQAMGGPGTAARWYRGSPRLMTGDLTHPTGTGADVVSGLLVDAIEAAYQEYRAATQPAAGSPAQAR
ncbi:MAG: GDSL-type esterase/lipase family protein [Thermoanaerobaculaceae bacterium]|nr:GDSL-type esterase/lipase family protein [Thermoanaerobaculaceae bacterium]